MNAIEFDRNRLLRDALQPEAGCPTLAELAEAVLASATTPEAEALRAHAARCSACAAEIELAEAFDAAPRNASEAEEIARVADQLNELKGTPAALRLPAAVPQMARVLPMATMRSAREQRSRRQAETPLWSRWAAAALVVIGLGFAFEWAHRSLSPALPNAPDADVVRSGEVLLDSPVGKLTGTLSEFSWRAVAGAVIYRVELRDVAGDLVWQGVSKTTTLSAPPELLAKLETFVSYRWNVTALDASSSAVAHSSPASFRIEPPAN